MTQDKKFRISVDDQKIRELRQTANELARDMIVSARQYSTSSKQVVQDIEEQIRLIEKRNRTDKEIERTKIDTQFSAGRITGEQRKEAIGRIHSESKVDDLQISLLRDIIDAIKQTAKDEIREDRVNVEKRIRESKTVDQLSPKIDPEQALRETIQKGLLGEVGREEATERRDFIDFGRGGKAADRTLSTVAGSSNEFMLMAAALAAIPVVGQGLSVAANRGIQEASRYEQAVRKMGILTETGISGGAAIGALVGGGRYGFSPAEATERYHQYLTSGQTAYGTGTLIGTLDRMFGAERRLGLSTEDISGVAGAGRYMGADPSRVIMMFETYLRKTDQNISLLPEVLRTYTSVANNLLQITTGVNTDRVAANIASLGQVTGAKGVGLQQWTQGVQGLSKTQNPMVRAMLMRKFMEKNPNASMFEIQAMMERPTEYMDVVGEAISEMQEGMGGDMGLQALYSFFGGQISRSELLRTKGSKFSDLGKGGFDTSRSRIDEDATPYIGAIERSQKQFEEFFQIYGEKMVSSIDEMAQGVKDMFGSGGEIGETTSRQLEDIVARGMERGLENQSRKGQQTP